jgi:3-methyladenine DNA glycosylase AlkD
MSMKTPLEHVVRKLAALEDPKMREANERQGDDHGVNLTRLRELAKLLKTQHELALELWATGDTAARLLSTLVCRPKALSAAELDAMIRDIRSPKLLDWFIVNMVKRGRHAEELRIAWKDGDDLVGRAGWSLTTERVVKNAEGLDLDALLDQIEKKMTALPSLAGSLYGLLFQSRYLASRGQAVLRALRIHPLRRRGRRQFQGNGQSCGPHSP